MEKVYCEKFPNCLVLKNIFKLIWIMHIIKVEVIEIL